MPQTPVTIILPVFNEVETIDGTLQSLVDQDYDGPLDIIVADGGSTDGTRSHLDEWAQTRSDVTVIDNDRRVQSHGLNAAAKVSSAPLVVRADGHTHYASDYVRRSVETVIETGAAAGAAVLPEKWTKPVVDRILVPAHAETSPLGDRLYSGEIDLGAPKISVKSSFAGRSFSK